MHLLARHQRKRRAGRGHTRRKTMKTMLLAAAAAFTLGIGSAYADSSGGTIANTFFTQLPGVTPTLPAQNVPAAATAQGGPHTYVTQSGRGTWLFRPHEGGGNNG
jgi:hypothetical protein